MTIFRKIFRFFKLVYAILWGFFTLFRIGSVSQPKRDVLSPYINLFCKKLVSSFGMEVKTVNTIPQDNALWVGNHISWVDVATVGTNCPVFFLAKAEVKSWPVIGKLATFAGTLYIKRGSGDAATVKDQIAEFLRQGISIIFFPEATTTDGRQVKKLHSKLIQASVDSGVPVQPVVMCYVDEHGKLDMAVPYIDDMTFGESMNNMFGNKKCTAYLMALEKIEPAGHTKESLTQELKKRMDAGLAELHAKVLTTDITDSP